LYTVPFAQVPIMYAIIQATGRQVKVTPGGFATLDGTAGEPGAKLTLEQVLLIEKDGGEVLAGAPFVANARVLAVVEGETRGPKIRVFKKKRRKGMRRTKGHGARTTRSSRKSPAVSGSKIMAAGAARSASFRWNKNAYLVIW
jgi:large subunit ribosomal protein L21